MSANLLQYTFGNHTTIILLWVIGSLSFVGMTLLLVWQYRTYKRLKIELSFMAKIRRHSVEHEMVLKSMHLSAWRIDARKREITYESDYRDSVDSYTPLPGESIENFVSHLVPADAERMYKVMNDICQGNIDEYNMQYQVLVPNSDKTYWSESYAMVSERDSNGMPVTIVGASMRIDRRKKLESELIEARNKAEESDRLKSAFLANISHEIRTPLNAIVGFSEVLPLTESAEERQGLVDLIHQNNQKMITIFENIVNMSKVEAGNLGVSKSTFQISDMLESVAEKFKDELAGKPIDVLYDIPERTISICTDKNRLQVILGHYMSNAIRFTEAGTITLGCRANDSGGMRIFVEDTGCGIPADKLDVVFERFVKLDEFTQGLGLGLSICRSFAYSLGGNVGVTSAVGKGSTFWIEFKE